MGDLKYLFFGLALVVMMIFRPEGLFPARQQLLAYSNAARGLLMKPGPLGKEQVK
jgi:branched-chain amino acid transport system permease protein